MPTVSVVVPAKNEAANLREVLPRLPAVHEVILVDGHSVDDTVRVAQETLPGIRVIHQTRIGKGNALACGFAAAYGDIIVMFDADGSADPAEIPAFVEALTSGADFAKGSRYAAGGGSDDITPLRSAGNRALNIAANRAFKTRFTDLCYGYNAFWRDLIPILDLPHVELEAPADGMLWGDGFEIETLMNCRFAAAGVNITEVPSTELSRIHGESNLRTFRDGSRVLRTIVSERKRVRQGLTVTSDLEQRRRARAHLDFGHVPHLDLVDAPRGDFGAAPRRELAEAPRVDHGDASRRDHGDASRWDHGDAPRDDHGGAPRRELIDNPHLMAERSPLHELIDSRDAS